MDHSVFSPTLFDSSFEQSLSFSSSADSLRPLLSSHNISEPPLFDAYIAEMLAKDHKARQAPPTAISTPTTSERSSMEEPLIDDSPSQATITQAAVRHEATKLKKKRSLGQALKSLKSSRDFTSLRGTKRAPPSFQLDDHETPAVPTLCTENLPSAVGVRQSEEEDEFDDRNRTVLRRNMPHHPFRPEDVPYMQAYNQILLENDYQTHQLLCRLKPSDSPTFHKFGKKPPADVLDLGCGEGFWVLHAAKLWKSSGTKVTGLDLIDVHNNDAGQVRPPIEPVYVPKNVTWLRANFVKHPLPFPEDSFDLVRMANLTLCIPISRWKFVLTEVRRVLRPGGRLELIDDDLFFPTILPRTVREPRSPSKRQWQRTASESMFDSPRSVSMSRSLSRSLSHKMRSDIPSPDKKSHKRSSSEVDFNTNSAIATHLETAYENMLAYKYGVSTHPHHFLERMLQEVFGTKGSHCARKTQQLELAVPAREMLESQDQVGLGLNVDLNPTSTLSHRGHFKRASEDDKYKGGRRSLEKRSEAIPIPPKTPIAFPDSPDSSVTARSNRWSDDSTLNLSFDSHMSAVAPKARQLLFGEGENMHQTPSWRATEPYQPPGLVLLPSTLIPFTPMELEMHACKHMNTLLGCKYALSKYVATRRGKDGQPLLSDQELDDYLWDYECFRRKRFNWPQDIPELRMDDSDEPLSAHTPSKPNIFNKLSVASVTPPESQRTMSAGSGASTFSGLMATKHSSTPVRTIRVYEAVKAHQPCHHHHHHHALLSDAFVM